MAKKREATRALRFPLIEAIKDTPWFEVEGHGGEHSKFSGDLQEPIIQSLSEMPVIDGEYQIDGAINTIVRQRIDKLVLLLKHYRIENTSDPWLFLSLRLACAFVPGLRVLTAPPELAARVRLCAGPQGFNSTPKKTRPSGNMERQRRRRID
jgi:hypothetical protein